MTTGSDNNKLTLLSDHALKQMRVRRFTEDDIQAVLQDPEKVGPAKNGAKYSEALLPSGRILRVIYDDSGPVIRVITVIPRRRIE